MTDEQSGTVTIHLRVPAAIAALLTKQAAENRRTRNAEAVTILDRSLSERVTNG